MEESITTWQDVIKEAERKMRDADEALKVKSKPSERRKLIDRKWAWKEVAEAIQKALRLETKG